MSKCCSNERGFTLIEMLVVLAIFMIISGSILYIATEKLINYTSEQFIDQTEVLIRLAQIKSIESKTRYEVGVFNCQTIYVRHYSDRDDVLFEQTLPQDIEVFVSTPSKKITFRTNGNINSAGSISYHLNGYYHNFSLNIGKGRLILKSVGEIPERANACGHTTSSRNPIFSNINTHSTDR